MLCQTDHGGTYAGPWDKAVGGNIGNDLRLCIVLHCQGQGSVVLSSRGGLHPVRHLLLHHDRDAEKGSAAFKESHDDGGGDVIGQVGHHLQRLLRDGGKIQLQDILVDDPYIIVGGQGLFQDGDQIPVDLHGSDLPCGLAEGLGQGADAGADLQNCILLSDLRSPDDLIQHMGVDEEVLAETLFEAEIMGLDEGYGILGLNKLC